MSQLTDVLVQAGRGASQANPGSRYLREVMGRGVCPANSLIPRCREKPRRELEWCPYRKPTQVGEEKILRRSSDPSLRNSANYPRNFGKRGALWGEETCSPSFRGPQRNGRGDCLLKTQDSAKS